LATGAGQPGAVEVLAGQFDQRVRAAQRGRALIICAGGRGAGVERGQQGGSGLGIKHSLQRDGPIDGAADIEPARVLRTARVAAFGFRVESAGHRA